MPVARFWIITLLLVIAAGVFWYRTVHLEDGSSTARERTRAILVTGGRGDFWQLTARGAQEAAAQYDVDLSVRLLDEDEGVREQMQTLIGLLKQPLDGCAISPLDAEGQTFLINQLAETMDIVTFDSDAPLSERRYYVGTSNYLAGKICQELVAEAIPDGGKILVLLSNLTKNNMIERKEGIEVNNSPEKWPVVGFRPDDGDKATARKIIEKTLSEHEDLAGIVGMNGYHGPLLRTTLTELGKIGKIKLVVFDEAEETLAGIEAGEIYATIVQDPWKYGYEAVRMLAALKNGNSAELPITGRGEINIRCQPIRQQDVEIFRTRLKQRLEE